MANTIVWLHYDEVLEKPVIPVWYSYLYFMVLIMVMLVLNYVAAKHIQLTNLEGVE